MQHSPPEYYHICHCKIQKNEDIEKNATFRVSNSQGIQNTKTSTLRYSTKMAA